ncbi:unnamed protein product [Acanthoscelides obtectus]|uniref:Uncharacterized protein n=1 Tax=Acanthoscelides obtectus TaxID=200917 RepID=A0A9P0JMS3_ACAOB|nr:unnamed protein product [Acanthoscelides obtectus]CAK1634881.1 hypothetical protein AOBTE_LOCUS8940 [Acanthoscelides obtectus]
MCACCMHTCSLARSPCGVPPFPLYPPIAPRDPMGV